MDSSSLFNLSPIFIEWVVLIFYINIILKFYNHAFKHLLSKLMASQVAIASSSPPFRCVLRDHNRRDNNQRDNLQKNSKDSYVINEEQKRSKIQGRWAQAREMVYNHPQIDNGDKNHKKAKLTREMVCNMLQIDQDDFAFNDEKIEKPKKQNNNVNDKKVINEVLQIDNGKNQNKSKIQERWARAREKVSNQSQTEVKQSKGSIVNSPKANEQTKNIEKNQKPLKNSERWARARESICKISNFNEKNNQTSNVNKEGHKSKEDSKDFSIQEDEKKLKKLRTHERWARAREIMCALDRQARDSNYQGVSSPLIGGGVSSLLQKWKGYEAEAKTVNSNSNLNTSTNTSPGCSIKSNSRITLLSLESSEAISADERDGNYKMMNIETFSDWENDKILVSGPPCTTGRESDVGVEEKEKIRVVDLIRKLTTTSIGKNPHQGSNAEDVPEGDQMLSSTESLPRVSVEMLSCPRVRGRQAFSNLLIQIERDRQRELEGLSERKVVSKFSNKGRLQALLKVKLMNRPQKTTENKDRMIPDSPVTSALNRGPHGSHIMHLRERFCTGAENSSKESVDSVPSTKYSYSSTQTKVEARQHDVVDQKNSCQNTQDTNNQVECNTSTSNQPKDDQVRNDIINPKESNKDRLHHVDTHIERKLSMKPREDDEANAAQSNRKVSKSLDYNVSDIKETVGAETIWEDIESCQDWLSDICQLRSEWEEMCNDQERLEPNNDWISEVARPKSDWEDMRHARYQEMLEPSSNNRDIRQLLERKSVSSFLSSNMRDAIDQLMVSRTQKLCTPRVESYIAKKTTFVGAYGKNDEYRCENDDNDNNNNNEVEIPIKTQFNDRKYPVQPHSQSLLSPWMGIHDITVSDYSNTDSPSIQRCESSNSSFPDNQLFSSFIKSPYHSPSLQMDFICDLRMHMEQLHQEMFQIRRSLKTCINMQVKLQRSVERSEMYTHKIKVIITFGQSAGTYAPFRKDGKDSARRDSEKGRCSVCNENHIDALFYRCGHMCTCFKCARDLQMSTGRCPICQAPILDVVKPYIENH